MQYIFANLDMQRTKNLFKLKNVQFKQSQRTNRVFNIFFTFYVLQNQQSVRIDSV